MLLEEEHIRLVKLGNTFCLDLAKITAPILAQFRPEIRTEVLYYLQDHTSLFAAYTSDKIDAILRELK